MSAVTVQNLSKRYIISHQQTADTMRDALGQGVTRIWQSLRHRRRQSEEFWAVRDLSFEIPEGQVVGLIGHNGAGKSTVLKLLSRITEPTTGTIKLNGRVASLLEVGTGFHPELSGRENIFLNGAILGMTRREIERKFDEIVEFAEVERFLDTPVKRYSSGMYVRLAFGVAAHLDPEILIVDEVLAVGDQKFQDKCLGKMRDVSRQEGRTVFFVSHNLVATQSLCSRVMLMQAGRKVFDGEPTETVARYLQASSTSPEDGGKAMYHGGDTAVRVNRLEFRAAAGADVIRVELGLRSSESRELAVELILTDAMGTPLALADRGTLDGDLRETIPAGESQQSWLMGVNQMANGAYRLVIQLVDPYAHVVLRYEHPQTVTIARAPRAGASRVLELNWQAGAVELPLRRE